MSGEVSERRSGPVAIRRAERKDVASLASLEQSSFSGDRISKRSFRAFLETDTALLLVAETSNKNAQEAESEKQLDFGFAPSAEPETEPLLGYALALFRQGARHARLYSLAVAPDAQRKGVANALIEAIEAAARERGAVSLRLEVREDNDAAIALYERQRFKQTGKVAGYYEDGRPAVRMEKSLLQAPAGARRTVPHYAQTTDFTCGPASLMMAMAALGSKEPLDREREFALWREATSIFLISAPGGCEPLGMAVTLARHGYRVSVHASEPGPYFVEARPGEKRRDIMREAQRIFRRQADELKIPIRLSALPVAELRREIARGAVAIVLVSSLRLHGDRIPHWIVAYDCDSHYIFAHDPWVGEARRKARSSEGLAIPLLEFERMAAFGRSRLKAALIVETATPQ